MSHLFLGRALNGDGGADPSALGQEGPVLAVDLDRCIACRACEVHCQVERGLGPALRLMRMIAVDAESFPGVLALPLACAHCEDPPCVAVCPTGAMRRRDDGIVVLIDGDCIGCRFCIIACPYGAPQYDRGRQRVIKCDCCVDRLSQGLWPACATKCSMKAIYLLDRERVRRVLAEARRRGAGILALGGGPASGP